MRTRIASALMAAIVSAACGQSPATAPPTVVTSSSTPATTVSSTTSAPVTSTPLGTTAPPSASLPASLTAPASTAPSATTTSTSTIQPPASASPTASTAAYPPGTKYALNITLKPGTKWSDGSPLTAGDYVGTYDVYWAQGDPIWSLLTDVRAADDTTLQFLLNDLNQTDLWKLIRYNTPAPKSQYSDFFARAHTLRASGAKQDAPDVAKFNEDLNAFKPDTTPGFGPFAIDARSITEAQMQLVKNPGGFQADRVDFDKVVVYWGDSQQAVPLLLSGDLDYSSSALTPADEQAAAANPDLQIIRGPLSTGPAVWFNETVAPFDKKEFRQAVAYVLDRPQIATVAQGRSGKPVATVAGFPDQMVDQWLSAQTIAKLNPYAKDLSKAEALLTSIGWNRKGNTWTDSNGKTLSYEVTVPSDFPDFLAAGQEVSQELNAFGIKTTVRGIASSDRPDTIKNGKYQILIDFSLISTPAHPVTSMSYYMAAGFFGSNDPEGPEGTRGLDWPWKQTAPDGTSVDIRDLLKRAGSGLDIEAQKPAVETLSLIFNEQLPIVPLFQRYTNDPINTTARVTGWLPLSDPIYTNNQGSDNYVAAQILSGQLKRSPTGDGSFHTNWVFRQPPSVTHNLFDFSNAVGTFLNAFLADIVFPPLFTYSQPEGKYVNTTVGESYELVPVAP